MFARHYAKCLIILVYVCCMPTVFPGEPPVETNMHHSLTGPNALPPDQMSVDARLAELGRILAAGMLRMRHQSSGLSAHGGDSSLAILPTKSVSRPRAKARIGGR